MKQRNKNTGVYAYLHSIGVLENSTSDERIHAAKQLYYKQYKANWARQQRRNNKAFTIYLNPQEVEQISREARNYKRSRTKYVKDAVLAYGGKTQQFLIPDVMALNAIREYITRTYAAIIELIDSASISFDLGTAILDNVSRVENEVLTALTNPKHIEVAIIDRLKQQPDFKDVIYKLLNASEP